MRLFVKNVALSLVDDSFIFTTPIQAIPLILPAYVAINTLTNKVLAYGDEAKEMFGHVRDGIKVVKPLIEGIVSNQEAAEILFRFGLRKIRDGALLCRPRMVVTSRSNGIGKLLIRRMAEAGGAREIYFIEMIMATAIGMDLDVCKPEIKAVLSVSEDWYEFAIISLAGVLAGMNGTIGLKDFVEDIQNHMSLTHHFQPEATEIESQLLSTGLNAASVKNMGGWEVWTGNTEQGRITSHSVSHEDITVGLMPSLVRLTERIKHIIRSLPKEMQYKLRRSTIHATGTAMRIPGLAQVIADQLGHAVLPYESDIHPSIKGCQHTLKTINSLQKIEKK